MKNNKCPWCNADGDMLENILIRNEHGIDVQRFIECKVCKARGPWVTPDNNPWHTWNRR